MSKTLGDLQANPRNPRKVTDKKLEMLKAALEDFGDLGGIVFNRRTGQLVGGHQRQKVLPPEAKIHLTAEYKEPTDKGTVAEGYLLYAGEKFTYREVDWDGGKEMAANVAANKGAGFWDFPLLTDMFNEIDACNIDLNLTMFEPDEIENLMTGEGSGSGGVGSGEANKASMADKFLVPPFSVLNARDGVWQDRKREWLALGIESEVGRGENLLSYSEACNLQQAGKKPYVAKGLLGNKSREGMGGDYDLSKGESAWGGSGTSIFDPVLCELAYRWFSGPTANILDPFAGGSVRGVVASKLGRQYVGCDLRQEQVDANMAQGVSLCEDPQPVWHCGDSVNIEMYAKGYEADLVFSCPPYFDLEHYSDKESDLSNMTYPKFLEAYRAIIAASCRMLKNDRFACFVVGEVRDKRGNYLNFVGDTVKAFTDAGLHFYNEAILVTAVGSLPIRAGRIFTKGRKLGKTHQNVLVFVKGDAKKATQACGEIEIPDLEAMFPQEVAVE